MHAGMRLLRDQQYTVTFPNKMHLSSAMLCTDVFGGGHCIFDCLVEVHLIENGTDHLVGILGDIAGHDQGNPILHCHLDLTLDPSKPFIFYARTARLPYYRGAGIGLGISVLSKTSKLAIQLIGHFDSK